MTSASPDASRRPAIESGSMANGPVNASRPPSPTCVRSASPALVPRTLDQSVMVAETLRSASLTAGSGTRSSMSIALRSNAMRFTCIDQPGSPAADPVFPVSFTIRASSSVPSRSRTARNLTSRPCISPSVTLRAPRSTSMPPTASAGIRHSGL